MSASVVHLAHPDPTWTVRRPSRPFWDWAVRATSNYSYTTRHALTAICSLILSDLGLADSSPDSPLMFRAAKEMIEKRFGRIWNPTGAKKMPTLGRKKPLNIMGGTLRHGRGGSARGALSVLEGSRVQS